MKKILITGATGFIGLHLCKRFISTGYDVHAIVRPNSNLDKLKQIHRSIGIYYYTNTIESLDEIIKNLKPDIVIHLAASFLKKEKRFFNVDQLIQSNILFGTQLVETMVNNKVYHLVNTGTSWQNFNNESYNPTCIYAATKQAYIDILKYYTDATDLKVINLKLFHTYGPDDSRKKLFFHLKDFSKRIEPLNMTKGEQKLDIVYIDDVIEAYLIAANIIIRQKNPKMEEYVVSSGKHISLKQLVRTYFKIIKVEENIKWGGIKYRNREEMVPYTGGKVIPGWKPKVSIEVGIKMMEGLV